MTVATATLYEVADINPRFDRAEFSNLAEVVTFVPMAKVSEVSGAITTEEHRPVGELLKGFTPFSDRDVLVAKITPCFENGKIAHARISKRAGFGSTEFHVVRADTERLDDRYLFHFLRQPLIRVRGEKRMTGSGGQRRVPKAFLESLKVPLPPLAEQRRIAAILDNADALRAKRREAIAKLDQLLQSVFLYMFGDPVMNLKGWPVTSLKDAGCFVQIGPFGSLLHKSDYIRGGVSLINPMHIIDGLIEPGVEQAVSSEKAQALGSYRLREGDVIMGRRGEMGRCAVVTSKEAGMLCGTGSLLVRPPANVLTAKFLLKVLSSPSMKKYLEGLAQGVTMPNLNSTLVENLEVVLPPLDLQHRYGQFVERSDVQRNRLHRWDKRQETLLASLQHRAFSGTL